MRPKVKQICAFAREDRRQAIETNCRATIQSRSRLLVAIDAANGAARRRYHTVCFFFGRRRVCLSARAVRLRRDARQFWAYGRRRLARSCGCFCASRAICARVARTRRRRLKTSGQRREVNERALSQQRRAFCGLVVRIQLEKPRCWRRRRQRRRPVMQRPQLRQRALAQRRKKGTKIAMATAAATARRARARAQRCGSRRLTTSERGRAPPLSTK